jgi:hypothetical protein
VILRFGPAAFSVLASACMPRCGEDAALAPDLPESTWKPSPPEHLHRTPIPRELREAVFPPHWETGRTWLTECREFVYNMPEGRRYLYRVRFSAPSQWTTGYASTSMQIAVNRW